jgi:hypothetical protein
MQNRVEVIPNLITPDSVTADNSAMTRAGTFCYAHNKRLQHELLDRRHRG